MFAQLTNLYYKVIMSTYQDCCQVRASLKKYYETSIHFYQNVFGETQDNAIPSHFILTRPSAALTFFFFFFLFLKLKIHLKGKV